MWSLLTNRDLTHAAAIAYYALLSLFPFLLLVISLLGALTADETARSSVLSFVLRYFPTRLDFVTIQLDAFRETRVQLGVFGGLGLVWASLGVFGAITDGVNDAWGVTEPRSFWKHRLVSFLMLVSAGGVLVLGLALVSAPQLARARAFDALLGRFPAFRVLESVAVEQIATALLIVAVGLVFYFVPNARTRFRDVWVGAVLTGLLWRAAFDGFSWYVRYNSHLTLIHGSITAVVVFLLWVYVSAVILMFGVEFTATYARLRQQSAQRAVGPPQL